jgi:hypothetical protein
MYISLPGLESMILTLFLQGIGPTLIAFRVVEESSETEVNATTRTSPLSHWSFRRTDRGTNHNSQFARMRASTIQFQSAGEDEHIRSVQDRMGTEPQSNALNE